MAAAGAVDTFCLAVVETFRNWSVLLIAKQHGCGGRNVSEKEEWLSNAVVQIFHDNESVYPDEIADFISEALFNEFDTIVEDGSLIELCQNLCSYYQLCRNNKHDEVRTAIQTLVSSSRPLPQVTVRDDSDSEEEEQHGEQVSDSHSSVVPTNNNCNADSTMDVDNPDDDGWEIVRRSKKR